MMPSLKERVHDHITPILGREALKDHEEHTDNTIDSQREYLKRVVMERAENPLLELDTLSVLRNLDENSICPFITHHLAEEL